MREQKKEEGKKRGEEGCQLGWLVIEAGGGTGQGQNGVSKAKQRPVS